MLPIFDRGALIAVLRTGYAGKSTFPEFLATSWRAGVIRYEVDFAARAVSYCDSSGEEYVEEYPASKRPSRPGEGAIHIRPPKSGSCRSFRRGFKYSTNALSTLRRPWNGRDPSLLRFGVRFPKIREFAPRAAKVRSYAVNPRQ
jgi:hypothetical protein